MPFSLHMPSGQRLSHGTSVYVCVCVSHSITPTIQVHLIDSSLSGPSKAPLSLSSLPQKSHSHSFLLKPVNPPPPAFTHTHTLAGTHRTAPSHTKQPQRSIEIPLAKRFLLISIVRLFSLLMRLCEESLLVACFEFKHIY